MLIDHELIIQKAYDDTVDFFSDEDAYAAEDCAVDETDSWVQVEEFDFDTELNERLAELNDNT